MNRRVLILALLNILFLLSYDDPAEAQDTSADLTNVSLEQLMNVEVFSASKKAERFFNTSAAVYVITPEDIRRSGANSIPDLLRMVPGISVQQVNAHSWDISARGFNGSVLANKLLVMIDGRAVYSPLFGGVFWELQDTLLEDIHRIEVIRGPGGALWGANAVNGVINIITKKAEDTQGGYVKLGAGTEERGFTSVRYGSQKNDWFYRTYLKYFNRDEGHRNSGTANDEWQMARTGFRAEKEHLTFQGDFYQGYLGQRATLSSFTSPYQAISEEPSYAQGGNLLTRYQQDDWSLQSYWQMTNQDFQSFKELRNMFDTEFNHHVEVASNQEVTWGLGYRLNLENMTNTETLAINENSRIDQVFSLFAQDEIKLLEDKLRFILGSKLEHNIYTDYEIQPNARVSYDLNDKNLVWAAVSQAIRTPSRLESDGNVLGAAAAPSLFTRLQGSHDLKAEKMRSYELGYRTQPRDNLFFDFSLFADHYDDLITYVTLGDTTENGFPLTPYLAANGLEGETYGIELSSDITLQEWWKIKGAYTFTTLNIMKSQDIVDTIGVEDFLENAVPRNSAYIRSSFDLPYGFELDTTFRYADSFAHHRIPSNTQMDISIGKTIQEWEIGIVGQNLLRDHHRQSYAGLSTATTQVERSVYVKAIRRF